jgi:hypothetical protein
VSSKAPKSIQSPLQLFGLFLAWSETALSGGLFATYGIQHWSRYLLMVFMAVGLLLYVLIAGFLLLYLVIKKPYFLFNPSDYDKSVQPMLFGGSGPVLQVTNQKEDVRGNLSVGSRVLDLKSGDKVSGLFLNIWNNGSTSVYIKSVALSWGEESSRIGASITELLFHAYPKNNNPLQPSEPRLFILPISKEEPLFEEAAKQTEDKIWVGVKSSKGEVLRIKGDQVLPLLRQ